MPETKGQERMAIFQIAFPFENMGANLPQVLTSVIGNISMAGKLKLIDIDFPKAFTDGFQGPRFGVEGLREITGVPKRPFIVSMIKPCTGATPENAGKLIRELAMAGIDWIKDDELFSDTDYCTVKARVRIAAEILKDVYEKTGKRVIYSPNITDRPDRMLDKAKMCKEMGIPGLMINALTVGWPAMQMIAENDEVDLPILAHPAFAGAMYESHYSGISSHLVLGKFMRMSGADLVIYPCAYGKVDIQRERYIRIAQSLLTDFRGMKRTFPGPAAGVYQGLIPNVADDLGMDFSISAGAAMHAHPMGAAAGVESLIKAAEATADGIPLEEAAKDCESLKAALDLWGIGVHQDLFDLKK
jgi:2,3-diketo-5-methylthiopentyl-1-phosphate enolase